MMEGTKVSKRNVKIPIPTTVRATTRRSVRSTPRGPVTSSTPAAATVYSGIRSSSTFSQGRTRDAARVRSRIERETAPSSSTPITTATIQWFPPAVDYQEPVSEIDENDSAEGALPPPLPEIIEGELTNILIDLENEQPADPFDPFQSPLRSSNFERHSYNGSAHELLRFLGLDQTQTPDPLPSGSEIRLVDFTNDGFFPESVSNFPSVRDLGTNLPSTSTKKEKSRSASRSNSRKAWPGRYKVKVMEHATANTKARRAGKPMNANSPYRAEEFIDIDGKLKLSGKGFETYVTRPQYQLLKDFYIPGVIASRVSKRKLKSSDTSLTSTSSRSSNRSLSPAILKPGREQEVTDNSKPGSSAHIAQYREPLRIDKIEKEIQTHPQESFNQESQTPKFRYRPTVGFDLDRTTVEDFERDSDQDLLASLSNESLTSAMGVLANWEYGDPDPDSMDADDSDELLNQKVATAVQMIAAILSAHKAGTESLASPTVLEAIKLLEPAQLEEVTKLASGMVGGDHDNNRYLPGLRDKQSLLHLMESYGAAYANILEHVRASEAYESKFPVPRIQDQPNEPKVLPNELNSLVNLLTQESSGDTIVCVKELLEDDQLLLTEEITNLATSTNLDNPHFLRYSLELTPGQLKFQLGATADYLVQEIHLHDMSLRMTYSINGVSTIVSASRAKDASGPISSGNLLLMHNQHASLLGSRLITAKYYFNRVLLQLMTLGELFLIGKYSKFLSEDTTTVSPAKYRSLRQINVFTSILLPLCSSFVLTTQKIQDSLKDLMKARSLSKTSLVLIGNSKKTEVDTPEVTVPMAGILPAHLAYKTLITALEEIDSIIFMGSTSLQDLNSSSGIKIPSKYYKVIVACIEGIKQLERGRDLDFGSLLIGYMVDFTLLEQIEEQKGQGSVKSAQKLHFHRNYRELHRSLQELTKLSRKTTLISSFASTKSMIYLRKFRYAQKAEFGCFHGILKTFQRRNNHDLKDEEKDPLPELTQEKTSLEQDKSRIVQMLRQISNDSSLSFSIF